MEKHYVTFYSPGTFVAEQSIVEIDNWDTVKAMQMADDIMERHNATPYGFRFSTRTREEDDFNSKETAKSNMYYLNGQIETLEEIKARNNPDDRILISNMESNNYNKVIVNTNSWKVTRPFMDGDVLLSYIMKVKK